MITLEQIRLLESKITRALELIHVLKDENSTLRKGLESAQRRMRELETLVDGFKTDQKEIESVIVRTLHNLDELEESAATPATSAAAGRGEGGIQAAAAGRGEGGIPAGGSQAAGSAAAGRSGGGNPAGGIQTSAPGGGRAAAPAGIQASTAPEDDAGSPSSKEELDIF